MQPYVEGKRFNWKLGCLIALGVVVLVAGLTASFVISNYNRAITLEQEVEKGWSEVENALKRRYDLIPNLVETVKGYATHEKGIFTDIANARKADFGAKTTKEKAETSSRLEGALSRLLMLRENYPQLKANQNFLQLQTTLEGTENRIAVARTRYNEAVKGLNSYVKSFFGRFFATLTGVEEAAYFDIPEGEKEVPKVSFE